MRVSRQWMDIEVRLRAGEAHDDVSNFGEGSLAIQCISCPRPGFNLPEGWENNENQYDLPFAGQMRIAKPFP
jgi:hypothetical protein